MIFATVGTQFPFDRMMVCLEEAILTSGYEGKVVAQVGDGSKFSSTYIECFNKLAPDEFYFYFKAAKLVVSHAGMGNVISCLDHEKVGFFLSRDHGLREHRNNHQFSTVKAFKGKFNGLRFFNDTSEFINSLSRCLVSLDGLDVYQGSEGDKGQARLLRLNLNNKISCMI